MIFAYSTIRKSCLNCNLSFLKTKMSQPLIATELKPTVIEDESTLQFCIRPLLPTPKYVLRSTLNSYIRNLPSFAYQPLSPKDILG